MAKRRNALIVEKESKETPINDFGVLNMTSVIPVIKNKEVSSEPNFEDTTIKIFKLYEDVKTPKYATERSACFDLTAYFGPNIVCVDTYNRILMHSKRSVGPLPSRDGVRGLYIEPGECIFIPTGLIFDIPEGFKLLFYPRSGLSAKNHLKLANCVGVIDEDYVVESMILLFNDSEKRQDVAHGDRIAQVELVPVYQATFQKIYEQPLLKSIRNGGMGHTGLN